MIIYFNYPWKKMYMNMANMELCQAVILSTMTYPAVVPPHSAGWGKGTVTMVRTVLETWFVAPTTVQLAEPLWIVVRVRILVSNNLFLRLIVSIII